MSGIVKSANKIENYIGILLQNPALCPGVPNQRGAQFARAQSARTQSARAQSAGAQFAAAGPEFARPNLPQNRRGAHFA